MGINGNKLGICTIKETENLNVVDKKNLQHNLG